MNSPKYKLVFIDYVPINLCDWIIEPISWTWESKQSHLWFIHSSSVNWIKWFIEKIRLKEWFTHESENATSIMNSYEHAK